MGPPADQRLARIAERQHGLVSHRQLAAVGLSTKAVTRRVEKGRLQRIHRGVYAVGHVQLTSEAGQRLAGVRVHRARRLDAQDVTVKDGIPLTTVARTLLDLTDLLGPDRILRAMREADFL